MRHLSICFLLSWFFVVCLFCVIRFGLGIVVDIERCISDLLFLANRHVVVSYWLRLLTRFNAMYVSGCITALEEVQNNTEQSSSSCSRFFYRSAMRLIAMPKCWPRAIILAKVAFFCYAYPNGGGTISNYHMYHDVSWCMFFEPNNPLLIFSPPSSFSGFWLISFHAKEVRIKTQTTFVIIEHHCVSGSKAWSPLSKLFNRK